MQKHVTDGVTINNDQIRSTWNPLQLDQRQQSIEVLNGVLADLITVSFGCRQAHWNVRGENFDALHKMFGDIHQQLDGAADELAERIATLGGIVRGSVQHIAADTKLDAYPAFAIEPAEHLSALAARLGALTGRLKDGIRRCEMIVDPVTIHHLTDVSVNVEKALWRIESHLKKV